MLVTAQAYSFRAPTLGFTLPDISGIPEWLKDWRVLAGIAAAIVLLVAVAGGKAARKGRRKKMMLARLKYAEDIARIKRT